MSSTRPLPRVDASPGRDLPPLVVRLDLVGGRLELSGHLDHRTAHVVHDAVSALLHTGTPEWFLDTAGLTGCDHIGLRTIGIAYRRAVRHGRRLVVVGTAPWLQAALTRLRLDHHVLAAEYDAVAPPASRRDGEGAVLRGLESPCPEESPAAP